MPIETYAEQLERVQRAIARIEQGGQTVERNGRRLTRGDLAELYARERELRRLVALEDGTGGMSISYGVPS